MTSDSNSEADDSLLHPLEPALPWAVRNLRSYLLGSLSTEDTEQLHVALLAYHSLPHDLNDVEDRLILDYFDGRLNTADLKLFHENYRPFHLERIALARLLEQERIALRPAAGVPASVPPKPVLR